jgi:hypothetical protein
MCCETKFVTLQKNSVGTTHHAKSDISISLRESRGHARFLLRSYR